MVHSSPVHSIIQDIVYCAQPSNVETSVINGKVVMEKGVIRNADEEDLLDRTRSMYKEKFGQVDFYKPMSAEF